MATFMPPTNPPTEGVHDVAPELAEGPGATTQSAALGLSPAAKPRSMFRRGWEVFAENKMALASLGFLVFIVLFCFIGPLIYKTNQVNTNLNLYLCRPSAQHLLGCNDVGYDQLGRLMTGGQTSLEVGFAAAIVSV